MTAPRRGVQLVVDADLRLKIDGQDASIRSEGRKLIFTSDAPQQVWASMASAALPLALTEHGGRRALGRVADALAQADLELHIVGPHGEIARLGQGARSWWGKAVIGSELVQVGSIRAVRPLVIGAVLQSPRTPRVVVGIALSALVAILLRRSLGRCRPA